MEFLRNWIEQIAIAVIIASIFEMLLPNGKIKKYIKMILGIFVVFSIISPFVNSTALYDLDVNEITGDYNITSQNSIDDKVEEVYIEELENNISKSVEEQGYNVKECKIDAVIYSDENEAGINNINITLLSKNKNYSNTDNVENSSNIETVNQIEIGVKIENTDKESNGSITEKDIKELKKYLSDYYEIDKKLISINVAR